MSCADITPKLELMADDELSSEQAAQVLSHIDDCPTCRDNWYNILALRQAIKEHATSFVPSEGFEDKLINSVRKEAWQSKGRQGKNPRLLYAAAALAAGALVTYFFLSAPSTRNPNNPDQVATISKSLHTIPNQQKLIAQSGLPQAAAPVSLEEALTNFRQYVHNTSKNEAGSATAPAEAGKDDYSALSSRAGFPIKPMQLSGFKLAGASLVTSAPGKANMVRLCYTRAKGKEHDSIICYQAANGNLVAKGLTEHLIDGKKICCGEVEDKSIVFIPGQKGSANEVLLVGTVSKSDLMDLVLSSS